MIKIFARFALAVLLLVIQNADRLRAESVVIVPNELASADAAFGSGTLANIAQRSQQVYGTSEFGSVTGALLITELRLRPDYFYGRAFSTTISNLQIRLSTTHRSPEGLSATFANNVGADDTVVFSGPLSISSSFSGPAGGPKTFDIVVPLSVPFVYDPTSGNLLVETRNYSGSTASLVSGQGVTGDGASRVTGGINAATGTADNGADALLLVYTPTNAVAPPPPPPPTNGVVVPNSLATDDAAFGSGTLANAAHRSQQVYGAGQFPTGALAITEIRFRPDYFYGRAFSATVSNIQVNLSITARMPEGLSGTFADNVGMDDTVVFSGPLSVSSSFSGPAAGPKAFDIVVPLSTPFVYNPASGNLLMDVRNYSGSSASLLSGQGVNGDGASRVLGGINAGSGVLDNGADAIQFTISLTNLPPTPPVIRIQPRDRSALVGATVSFSIVASGTAPLSYQWQFNAEPIAEASDAVLVLSNLTLSQAGLYSVIVSNAQGLTISSNATLTVNVPPPPATYDLSRDFSLSDNPNGPWRYGWKTALDGTFALNLIRQTGMTGAGVALDLWGYRPFTLPAVYFNASADTAVTEGGQGTYPPGTVFFLAGNDGAEQNFGAIRLTVPLGADGEYRLESAVRTYLSGSVSGDTDYHVVKNGVELFGQFMPGSSSSGYTNTLTLAGGDIVDFLVGRGQDGRQFASGLIIDARLYALNSGPTLPTILVQPRDRTVFAGASVDFFVEASGTVPLSYQWQFNAQPIDGASNAVLVLNDVRVAQEGDYSVVVSNAQGVAVSSNATLTVKTPPTPANYDLSRDFSLTDNPNGVWSYGWKSALNGTFALNLVRQTGVTSAGVPLDLWGFQPFTLPAVYFNASSSTGVTHSGQGVYPPGTVFFLAGNDDTEQNLGAIRLTLRSGADGQYRLESAVRTYLNGSISGDTDYHVVKNGVELFGQFMPGSSVSGYTNILTLAGGDTIDFLVGRGQDGHQYASGLVIDARLYLLGITSTPPAILIQPQSHQAEVGDNLTLAVVANGSAPLHYQWRKNQDNLPDAVTDILTFNHLARSDSGDYSVVVQNDYGAVTSHVATLVVNQGPAILRVVSTIADTNGEVSFPIELVANGNENSIGFSLSFDATVLQFVDAIAGNGAQGASLIVNSDQAGGGRLGFVITLPPDTTFAEGTHQLARITMGVVTGTNRLVTPVRFRDQPVLRQVADVAAHPLNATFVDGTSTIEGTGINGPGFEADVSPRPNGDNMVSAIDLVQMGRFVAGLDAITNQMEFQRADCAPRSSRGDGSVTLSDLVQAGRYAAGLDPLTATGGPSELGVPGGFAPAAIFAAAATHQLIIASTNAQAGATLALPVRFESQGNENGLSFSISFAADKLQFLGASTLATASSTLLNINTNQAEIGKIGFAMTDPPGTALAPGSDDLLLLNFAVRPNASGTLLIGFSDQPVLREMADVTASKLLGSYGDGMVTIGNSPSGPPLTILRSGASILLLWPSSAQGFELRSAANLTTAIWGRVTVSPIEFGGQMLVSLPATGSQQYFRLVKP